MIEEWFQNRAIRRLEEVANDAAIEGRATRGEVTNVDRRVDALELDNERLKLLVAALTEILREHSGITTERIEAKIDEIDARDGALDGKLGSRRVECPKCRRPARSNRQICFYCEAPLPVASLI